MIEDRARAALAELERMHLIGKAPPSTTQRASRLFVKPRSKKERRR